MYVVAGKRVKVAPVVVIPHEKDLAVAEVAQRPRPWRPPGAIGGQLDGPGGTCYGVRGTVDSVRGPAPHHNHSSGRGPRMANTPASPSPAPREGTLLLRRPLHEAPLNQVLVVALAQRSALTALDVGVGVAGVGCKVGNQVLEGFTTRAGVELDHQGCWLH